MIGSGKVSTWLPSLAPRRSARPATPVPRSESPGLAAANSGQWLPPDADELFRGIYTRAELGAEVLSVCSAIQGEGKTTVALGLAVTIAQDFPHQSVLLVETDMRRPVLARDLGIEETPGLADCLADGRPSGVGCHPTSLDNLAVMPAGSVAAAPGRVLRSHYFVTLLEEMRRHYTLVILDVPAILTSSDAVAVTHLTDATLFVVRAGATPSALVRKALDQLDATKLRGMVMNEAHSALPRWLQRLCSL